MTTCRAIIADAVRACRAVASGDDLDVDELATAMSGLSALVLEIHEARGAMTDVDVSADYTAGENQRVRVQSGAIVTVKLPNSVPIMPRANRNDYGFAPAAQIPVQGSTSPADGVSTRPPRDGVRVEIVGTTQGLSFYRADVNQWAGAYDLGLDDECPLNARYSSHLAALLAGRILDLFTTGGPTPMLLSRMARANVALMLRVGAARDPVIADYV